MESGFRINNLILLESKFKRINNVQFEDANLDLNIDTEVSVNNNIISVAETVSVKKTHNNTDNSHF